ncbi:MAG: hypothetical protein HY829_06515, partial [Actinobacteria bacterium]|nr:hypothetical protein [Actinomycetota bacterium]
MTEPDETLEDLEPHGSTPGLDEHDHVFEDARALYDRGRGLPLAEDELGRPVLCRHADVTLPAPGPETSSALPTRVITVSDEVAAGTDGDRGGLLAVDLLTDLGTQPTRVVVPD